MRPANPSAAGQRSDTHRVLTRTLPPPTPDRRPSSVLRRFAAVLAAAAAPLAGAQPAPDTYDLEGLLYGSEAVQMELTVAPDAAVSGYFFVESVKLPRLVQGHLDRKTGRVALAQFDQRCKPVARFEGELRGRSFSGTWTDPHTGRPVPFALSERAHPLRGYDASYRCDLPKGQFSSHLELVIRAGALRQFTYLTNFVGGKEDRPWYCAVNSLEPDFESTADDRQIVLTGSGGNGCRIVIRDTGDLLKVQFQACNAFCQRTAFPHSLLIDKRSGRCAEFAVPQGRCPVPN